MYLMKIPIIEIWPDSIVDFSSKFAIPEISEIEYSEFVALLIVFANVAIFMKPTIALVIFRLDVQPVPFMHRSQPAQF